MRADPRTPVAPPAPQVVAIEAPAPDAAVVAPQVVTVADAAVVPDATAQPAARVPTRHVETAVTAPAPPTAPSAAPPPSGAEIAKLYAEVGRELRTLDEHKGLDATIDLWPRYRWIRIHEWLLTPEKRTQAAAMLERLRHDIRAQL